VLGLAEASGEGDADGAADGEGAAHCGSGGVIQELPDTRSP